VPKSGTERFARTYTPRTPDDGYDSIGGLTITTLVKAPVATELKLNVKNHLSALQLFAVIVRAGYTASMRLFTGFSGGALVSAGVPAPVQHDGLSVNATLAGGTLK